MLYAGLDLSRKRLDFICLTVRVRPSRLALCPHDSNELAPSWLGLSRCCVK